MCIPSPKTSKEVSRLPRAELTLPLSWEAEKEKNSPKCQGRPPCRGLLDPESKGVSQESFAPPKPSFAATPFHSNARGICSLGPKDLLHPLLATFEILPFFWQFPRSVASPKVYHWTENDNIVYSEAFLDVRIALHFQCDVILVFQALGKQPGTTLN